MRAKKFGAMAMAMAMAATMMPMSTFAQEEETYDFGGAEVRVFGNKWNDLDPDAEGDKTQYLDAAAQVEEKYNIKFVYAKPDGYDGYNLGELIQAGITAGDAGVDILDSEPDALISLLSSGALTDLTNEMDQIHVGSLYKEAVNFLLQRFQNGEIQGFEHFRLKMNIKLNEERYLIIRLGFCHEI